MAERLDIYKCEICGTIIQVMHRGDGELVCCGHPMKYLQPQTQDAEKGEKHVPVFIDENIIQVGSIPHPMTEDHHIDFIECISDDKKCVNIKFLDVTDMPKMEISQQSKNTKLIEYCNIHGLWANTN